MLLSELATLYFAKSDMDRARHYIRQFYRNFISSLSRLHPLANNSRFAKLQGIQKVCHLKNLVQVDKPSFDMSFRW